MHFLTYPETPLFTDSIATTGFFDGVHCGHLTVLKRIVEQAHKQGKPSCVVTFWPHPRIVLDKDTDKLKLLSTLEEKKQLIAESGIDNLIIVPFNYDLSSLTAEDFFQKYLINYLHISSLIIGYDHHFGRGGTAHYNLIEEIGLKNSIHVERIKANIIKGITVSSSKIRELLQIGDITLANQLLSYPYTITGMVIHGKKLGRQMGFPTANIQLNHSYKLLPQDGIYAVEVLIENSATVYQGMLSIGIRPTIDDSHIRTIEVNIFEFDRIIYGETITVRFIARLRDEYKFANLGDLQQQLWIDKQNALEILNK